MTSDPASEVVWGRNSKYGCFSYFEGRTLLDDKNIKAEAMESIKATEAVEAMEVVEAVFTIETKVLNEGLWIRFFCERSEPRL